MNGNISIVIGSWGSYNECNERALGSKWLDLSDYDSWDEIVEELKKEGFELVYAVTHEYTEFGEC